MENANSPEYLEKIKNQVIENLKRTAFAPSVPMTEVPRDSLGMDEEDEAALDDQDEDENKDVRYTERRHDKQITHDADLSESEDEDMNERNGVRRQPGRPRRRNIMDYQNPHAVPDSGIDSGGMGTPEPSAARATEDVDDDVTMDTEATTAAADATNGRGENGIVPTNKEDNQMKMEEDAEEEQQAGDANVMDTDGSKAKDAGSKEEGVEIKVDQDEQVSATSKDQGKDEASMDVDEVEPTSTEKQFNDDKVKDKDATEKKTVENDSNEDSKDSAARSEKDRASSSERSAKVVTASSLSGEGGAQVTPPESPPTTSAPVVSGEMAAQQSSNAPARSEPTTDLVDAADDSATLEGGEGDKVEKRKVEGEKEKDGGDKDIEMAEADEQSATDADAKAKTEGDTKSDGDAKTDEKSKEETSTNLDVKSEKGEDAKSEGAKEKEDTVE